ncbi:MAG: hypothetical protein QOK43_2178 [Acidimicrobiaceae bacterium]|nr:hypothetical protein [Acidimicrobiaceae bacterium]
MPAERLSDLPRTAAYLQKLRQSTAYIQIALTSPALELSLANGLPRQRAIPWSCAGKPLLAMALARLANTGTLSLDAKVADVVGNVGPWVRPGASVRDCLAHIGSIRSEPRSDGQLHARYTSTQIWQVLERVLESAAGEPAEEILGAILSEAGCRSTRVVGSSRAALDASQRCVGPAEDLCRFFEACSRWSKSGSDSRRRLPVPAAASTAAECRRNRCDCGMFSLGFETHNVISPLTGRFCSDEAFGHTAMLPRTSSRHLMGFCDPAGDLAVGIFLSPHSSGDLRLRALLSSVYRDLLEER